MSLGRREIQMIQRALRERLYQVPFNLTWKKIFQQYGIGRQVGSGRQTQLNFIAEDLERLQSIVQQQAGIDPIKDELAEDRFSLAEQSNDEKRAKQAVFADLLQAARPGLLPINTPAGPAVTPPGSLLSVLGDGLDLSETPALLVIENGTVIRHWAQLQLPESCQQALLLYRGHGSNARASIDLINHWRGRIPIIGFYDFDPAGIKLALEAQVDAMLLPRYWAELTQNVELMRCNKSDSFWDQVNDYHRLEVQLPATLQQITRYMYEKRLALTQETLVAHRIELMMLTI